jgi:hypothetical protein
MRVIVDGADEKDTLALLDQARADYAKKVQAMPENEPARVAKLEAEVQMNREKLANQLRANELRFDADLYVEEMVAGGVSRETAVQMAESYRGKTLL